MATTTRSSLLTLTPNPCELDVQIQALVNHHGLGAVGKSLTQQYGQTQVIAAALGQLGPDAICSTSTHR